MKKDYNELLWHLFAVSPTEHHRKKLEIIEAAIKVFARYGFDKSSYDKIATRCKLSRPLIHYYFSSREELFEKTILYVRYHWQQFVVEDIKKAKGDARDQLRRYVTSTLRWTQSYPNFPRIHLLFYFQSSREGKMRDLNTQLVETGLGRMRSLLELGNLAKEWQVADVDQAARRIHLLITGAAFSLATQTVDTPVETVAATVLAQIDLEANLASISAA